MAAGCRRDGWPTWCKLWRTGRGAIEFVVAAPGHRPARTSVSPWVSAWAPAAPLRMIRELVPFTQADGTLPGRPGSTGRSW